MSALLNALEGAQLTAAFTVLAAMLLWETAHPFFDLFGRSQQRRGVHLARNLAIGGLNAVLIAAVFAGLWLQAAAWAEAHHFGLLHTIRGLPTWAHAAGAVLLLDAWTYTWHRLNHHIPFLWRFHRVHHADAQMDVTTASRFHLGEIFFSSVLRLPLIVLLGVYVWELVLYETLMFAVVQFHHANVVLPPRLDRALRLVIVTPGMHKVHHSRWQPETDANYSALLSLWDRLLGSYRTRERLDEIQLGLHAFDDEAHATFKGLMTMPLAAVRRPRSASTAAAEDAPCDVP